LPGAPASSYERPVSTLASPASPVGVVCDFDGTATLLDIGDEVSRHFGGVAHWEERSAAFRRGELDTRGIIEAIYETVSASEPELQAYAVSVARLRPGFAQLIEACRSRGAPLVLASGGLRQYIEPVLASQLSPDARAHVQVRANEAIFDPPPWKVRFPADAESRRLGCSVCGSCKRVAVSDLRTAGVRHIIGIGDGFADRCLAQFADRIFAREGSYLHRYCLEQKLPHGAFTTLEEAALAVKDFEARD
jgi:2-hydroxy-3-keto-5-methylthiopentenyl-1-phosphate phosphatase